MNGWENSGRRYSLSPPSLEKPHEKALNTILKKLNHAETAHNFHFINIVKYFNYPLLLDDNRARIQIFRALDGPYNPLYHLFLILF
jgi:hypothetical protein